MGSFGGGDPCPGTPKVLKAAVACGDDKARSKALRDVIYRTRHPLAAASHAGWGGGEPWLDDLLSFNLTFSRFALSIEHDAPGLIALVAAISTLLALVLLLMAAVLCVRLRRLQVRYAQLTHAAREGGAQPKRTEPLDDVLEKEMTSPTGNTPPHF